VIKFLLFTLFHFIINKIFVKKNFLLDKQNISHHKKKVISNLKTPLSGGFIFIILATFTCQNLGYLLLFFILTLYLIGLASDINFISSPKIRILLQALCVLFFIILNDLSIRTLSIGVLDKALTFKIFNIIFLLACLLVLINGFNFLDGINTLVIGYFIICIFSIYYISKKNGLFLDFILIENLLMIFFTIYVFNFFGKSFLGDSGTYSISFLVGILSVNFAHDNYLLISPYFIACILCYPAFENLFSIIRRLFSHNQLSKADNFHLHHLLYEFIEKNFLKKSKLFINTFTGILINIYLVFSAFLATVYFNDTKSLLLIIFFNFNIYLVVYFILYKKRYIKT
jgi:UDP-N-acetylmuramyl pentapeptide phosphotransferase/UDP-N-acetylglucosamine-1-phosphate transferase